MTQLTVWKFDGADTADSMLDRLKQLQEQELITINDAAVVSWKSDAKKPKTRQEFNTTGAGALDGTFWGLLFGLLFFVPLFGAAIGALTGAITGSLVDVGIDDDFIARVRTEVTPGTSALFLLASDAVLERIQAEFADDEMELIASNLTSDQEATLHTYFG